MKQIYVGVVTAVAAFAFTFAIAAPESAHAAERRIAGAGACTGGNGHPFMGQYQVWTDSSTVHCGVVSDSTLSHNAAAEVNVHVWATAPRSFSACATSPWVTQIACGPSTTSGTGNVTVTLNRSGWNAAGAIAWFPYISATLSGGDRIKGIWFRD